MYQTEFPCYTNYVYMHKILNICLPSEKCQIPNKPLTWLINMKILFIFMFAFNIENLIKYRF